jgi:hypothetical protein
MSGPKIRDGDQVDISGFAARTIISAGLRASDMRTPNPRQVFARRQLIRSKATTSQGFQYHSINILPRLRYDLKDATRDALNPKKIWSPPANADRELPRFHGPRLGQANGVGGRRWGTLISSLIASLEMYRFTYVLI